MIEFYRDRSAARNKHQKGQSAEPVQKAIVSALAFSCPAQAAASSASSDTSQMSISSFRSNSVLATFMALILLFAGRAEGVSYEIQFIDFSADGLCQNSTANTYCPEAQIRGTGFGFGQDLSRSVAKPRPAPCATAVHA
ncbi:MAG: hypothetical protein WA889_07685 [Xanthobacteraceae bacterium]